MKKELVELRKKMAEAGIHIYLIPTGDFHGSEYLHDYFKTREFISGFTGSAGTLIVTADDARLWTDGRYFLQAAIELEGSGIELMKAGEPGVPEIKDYLKETIDSLVENGEASPSIGFDGRVIPCSSGREYGELALNAGGRVVSSLDLAGDIWESRPVLQGKDIWSLPLESAGLPYEAKIKEVRELMKKADADYQLITTLDDNAWLYNLRGSDVVHTPIFFSYTLITPKETILYIFKDKCPGEIIPEGVTVKDYFIEGTKGDLNIIRDLENLPKDSRIQVSPGSASYSIIAAIPEDAVLIETDFLPSSRLKACKNPTEIESTKEAHINDGVAMVNFIKWVKEAVAKESHTELSVSDHLEKERAALPGFLDLSFDTIAGYMDHGAIVHYSATPETDYPLKPEGLLLVDSGGQYISGTTDITRTIALGPLTDKMKEAYTTVLKGHARLAIAKFKDGTTGIQLDRIVKEPLEDYGISYNHGTGHGVGHVLCVHEGPQRINTICEEVLIPGMITSNEPGYYPEGEFGIRIENEILCIQYDGEMDSSSSDDASKEKIYCFQNLTCCPYEREAIIKEMLTEDELEYIDSYHSWVYESLKDRVSPEVSSWLEEMCAPL